MLLTWPTCFAVPDADIIEHDIDEQRNTESSIAGTQVHVMNGLME